MKYKTYSHLCRADDWNNAEVQTVLNAVEDLSMRMERGCSTRLRKSILKELAKKGWSSKVKLSSDLGITITAINRGFGLCLQAGNMSRFYADLLKLQYLYDKGSIKQAIYTLPTKYSAKIMGHNIAQFERFIDELNLFAEIITVPIFVIGIGE